MTLPLRVLYIDGVGPFGGASRSLYEVLNALPPGATEAFFVMQRGSAAEFYGRVSKEIISTWGLSRFDHSRASYYRGVRWIVVLREIAKLPSTVIALLKAKKRWRTVDIIHINEISEILPGLLAKWLFRAPLIVHTRSLRRVDARSLRSRWFRWALGKYASAIIAIDEGVRATLPEDLPVDVIHNSFSPALVEAPDECFLSKFDTLRSTALKVGFVGNVHYHKGMIELFRAAEIVKAEGHDVQYVIVGGSTSNDSGLYWWALRKLGLAQNIKVELESMVATSDVSEDFRFFGPTNDIQRAYEKIDVIAFPSHYDAPGRPVFEAAFFGAPSIVAVRTPRVDTLIDRETGIAIDEPDPRMIADAIIYFATNRDEVARMGSNARALALRNFVPAKNAERLLEVYRRVASQ